MRIFRVEPEERPAWAGPIAALEASASYPLGADRFRIDHGADYFAFFDRLGEVAYYVAADEGEVVAVGAGMLRRLPFPGGWEPAWYVGDLKVVPTHRGRHLPLRMLAAAFPVEFPRCRRGYGISMDPPGGRNRVLGISERFPLLPVRQAASLAIWSLTAEEVQALGPVLRRHRGAVSWLSLTGVKDLVLASTGRPLALRHAQHGPLATGGEPEPTPGATHMISAPVGDLLGAELAAAGVAPPATATVIAAGMDGFDWRQVLTSEI